MMDLSAWNQIGQTIIGLVETIVSLGALHAGVSIVTALSRSG